MRQQGVELRAFLTSIESYADEHSGLIALFRLVVALVTLWITLLSRRGHAPMTLLLDHRSWPEILASLSPGPARAYQSAIERVESGFTHLYGPRLLGLHAFNRALEIAFAYSISTLLIGWLLFDAGHLGGAEFLPEGLPLWRRAIAVLAMAIPGAIIFAPVK